MSFLLQSRVCCVQSQRAVSLCSQRFLYDDSTSLYHCGGLLVEEQNWMLEVSSWKLWQLSLKSTFEKIPSYNCGQICFLSWMTEISFKCVFFFLVSRLFWILPQTFNKLFQLTDEMIQTDEDCNEQNWKQEQMFYICGFFQCFNSNWFRVIPT